MDDRSHIKTVEDMLAEAVAHNAFLDEKLTAIRLEMTEISKMKELANAKVDTFKDVLAALVENEQKTNHAAIDALVEPGPRRMRLGSKKRVIYQLIEAGANTLYVLNNYITDSLLDIDSRYVREVVRSGLSDGDFAGDLEGSFTITTAGQEIMTKAPYANDWGRYIEAVGKMMTRLNVPPQQSNIWN